MYIANIWFLFLTFLSPAPSLLLSDAGVSASGLDGDVTQVSQHVYDLWDKMSLC